MVLELLAGGYLLHRHYKKNREKRRLEEEAFENRSQSFPGPRPQRHQHQICALSRPHHRQMTACGGHPRTRPPHQMNAYENHPRGRPVCGRRRAQSYEPAKSYKYQPEPSPVTQRQEHIQPVQRADSFASTLSTSPVANGPRCRGGCLPRRQESEQQSEQAVVPSRPFNMRPYNSVDEPARIHRDFRLLETTIPRERQPLRSLAVGDVQERYGSHSTPMGFDRPGARANEDEDDPPPPYEP
ncbi:hypothetical protein M011DRAFT_457819 [Sporormia fimetaria CBS 119925]|uniref:Uncharacterized protein n=1 Tax=Sporormia fimetaria CBS 119925 TaxID=1340428 RepID=A0A6A6VFM6_9PLEO|nr:hypothetical protein M011DRAFT_457819 [Sporormia fimetaria CBS 119925]